MSEQELITAAQNGDREALAALVKMYEKTVFNFAFKVCRNLERAENAMQETFLSMIKNLKQFDGKSKLSTWLYTIVSNNCLMAARSQKRHEFDSLDDDSFYVNEKDITGWDMTPDKVAENNELKAILDGAISKLPPDYKVVFLLRDVEGLSTEETALIAKLSVPAVKSRLHRARAFLRNELNKAFQNA
ncbi:MAG TPA: sigma-70 family RNA polymerase sigma factor [Ignavibacteriales bacterium]|nr:sigma-70 family RNA polymerase sigma factor [Ignavibacteriales bacterium]